MKRLGDVVQSNAPRSSATHRVEEHLQQQVAELLAQLRVVAGADRVVDLVGFLDQIGAQRLVRLRRVPLAARAQIAHQRERIFK